MGSALLSRFDLLFILLDTPDSDLDIQISEHVMALHQGRKKSVNTSVLRQVRGVTALLFSLSFCDSHTGWICCDGPFRQNKNDDPNIFQVKFVIL